jgi:quercetin dioxygenase-like cupin family protein
MKPLPLICLFTSLLTAQSAPEVEITAEPHHHLAFENKSVRVFNVEVDPNDATQLHWHRHDYIAVTLGPAEIANNVKDKLPVTVKFADGDTRFVTAPFAHYVRTTSPQPFRNVTVEILEDATLRNSTAKWDEDRALDILPNGTQQILFVKDGIRATEFDLQPGGVVPMHHYSGPHLFIAVTDLDILAAPPTTRPEFRMPVHLKSGDSKWLPGDDSRSITNIGPVSAKFVTLEFP